MLALARIAAFAVLAAPTLPQRSDDATVLVLDCGPADTPFLTGAGDNAGAGEHAWVPLDHTLRATGWSHAAPQYLEYTTPADFAAGRYEVHAWVCIQEKYRLSLSLLINDQSVAQQVFDNTQGQGYPPFCLTGRLRLDGGPTRVRLAAERIEQGDRIRAVRIEFLDLARLTADGNAGRVADLSVSESLGPEYPVAALTDGVTEYQGTTRGRSWASTETATDHWVELSFTGPEGLGRVVLYWPRYPEVYNTARRVLVQVPEGDGWRTVGAVESRVPMPRSEAVFGPIEAARVRLLMPAGHGAHHRPNILWLNEVQLWRPDTPAVPAPAGLSRLSWSRAEQPDRPEGLAGGEVEAEALVLLAHSPGIGPPSLERVQPASARDDYDWWWDGAPLAQARAAEGRVHRLVFAPRTPDAPPVTALTLRVPGEAEIVRHDDLRVLPPPYVAVPRMSDEELFAALDLSRPGLEKVGAAVAVGDLEAAKQCLVSYILTRDDPPPPPVRRTTLVRPDDEPPDREAERFLNHEWYFYKYRQWRPLGEVINWYLPDGDGSDRHYIARLDLMRYMVNRWEREGDDRWPRGWVELFRQFYENAPSPADPPLFPASHLPWCGLCSAIRIRGVLEDYSRVASWPGVSVDDHVRVYKSALEHARFLARCDGGQFFAANHQMGHLVALEEITATFPEFRETAEWRPYLQSFLLQHLDRDTFEDGGSVDTAAGYGLWVATGLFTEAYLYAADAGLDLGSRWRRRLEKMYEWCLKIGAPDGGHLALGDDNYRLDTEGFSLGASTIGYQGALLFGRPDFLWFASRPGAYQLSEARKAEIAEQTLGRRAALGMHRLARLVPRQPDFLSVNLPDTGWTILRSDWSPRAVYVVINHHRGGHCHKTQNDLNIVAYGKPFITDAGIPHTYSTDRWQGWYVKTIAHNTVMVDDQDMEYGAGDPGRFFTSPPVDFLRVSHGFYRNLGITEHQRSVLFVKDTLLVLDDRLAGTGRHKFSWLAHFQPMPLPVDAERGLVRTGGDGPGLALALSDPAQVALNQARGWMNVPTTQVCEEVEDAPYISLDRTAEPPVAYGVAIGVAPDGAPAVEIAPHAVDGGPAVGAAYRVHWPGGVADVAFCHGEPALRDYGPITTDALAAAVITRADGSRLVFLVGGTEAAVGDAPARSGDRGGPASLQLAGGPGSATVELSTGTLRAWVEGEVSALRVRAGDAAEGAASDIGRIAEAWVNGTAVRPEVEGGTISLRVPD